MNRTPGHLLGIIMPMPCSMAMPAGPYGLLPKSDNMEYVLELLKTGLLLNEAEWMERGE